MTLSIAGVYAREILDSRGNPTVEVDVELEDGTVGRAAVPSGASRAGPKHMELRDTDAKNRYLGKGVRKAVQNVNETLSEALIDLDVADQAAIDHAMIEADGTENKANLGANAILACSLACARGGPGQLPAALPLYRRRRGQPASVPMMNIINGGRHADNAIDIQEFMIVPAGFDFVSQGVRAGVEVFHSLKSVLSEKKLSTLGGGRRGVCPDLKSTPERLDLIVKAIEKAKYVPGEQVKLALDSASTEFYDSKTKKYALEGKKLDSAGMVEFLSGLAAKYPICSIEDGCSEDDWEGWKLLTEALAGKCQLVGDDLFVTNVKRLQEGIDKGIANSILIKVNQIGTLTETIDAVQLASRFGYTSVISHRSGETEDTTIADLAVALGTGQIKTGSASRTDRICKYNQLLRIEEILGSAARYGGTL